MNLTDYWAGSYWTPGDPAEDSDARPPGQYPRGLWLNDDGHGNVQCFSKQTCDRVKCTDVGTIITPYYAMFPPMVRKLVRPSAQPTPTPQSTPGPGITPTPSPSPGTNCVIPTSCPGLAKWGNKLHQTMTKSHQPIIPLEARVGALGVYDSTARFGGAGSNGKPCNDEHHEVCSSTAPGCSLWRRCEDPRGPTWAVSGPAKILQVVNDGWMLKVEFTGPGTVEVTTCPRSPLVDEYGQGVTIHPDSCSTSRTEVR